MKPSYHLVAQHYFVADNVERRQLMIECCPTDDVMTDLLAKPLQGSTLLKLVNVILLDIDKVIESSPQECVGEHATHGSRVTETEPETELTDIESNDSGSETKSADIESDDMDLEEHMLDDLTKESRGQKLLRIRSCADATRVLKDTWKITVPAHMRQSQQTLNPKIRMSRL